MSSRRKSPKISQEAAERQAPGSHIVHEAIVAEGMEELNRPTSALAWSALAGGFSIGTSLLAEAALQAYLPVTPWRPLVSKLGYAVGFLIVILGRQQLFTENTLTPILPLLERRSRGTARNVLRLWITVLLGNLVGTAALAFVIARTDLLTAEMQRSVSEIAHRAMEGSFGLMLLRGVFAGWLVALLVWVLPAAEAARVWMIIIIAWLIGVTHFSHVVAGATDVFSLAWSGEVGLGRVFGGFIVPTLLGNVTGGVALVACVNHAQVSSGEK